MDEREKIMKFLIDHIPLIIDLEIDELAYDKASIYYKIYKYIKELEKESAKRK